MKTLFSYILILAVLGGLYLFTLFPVEEGSAGEEHNVAGYAWSENIGWISFNSTNTGSPANYGVSLDTETGVFSGYAWSENIGWITFQESELAGCPTAPCRAQANLSTNEVSGWARALSYGDGWDGWIHLRGPNYGVSLADTGTFSGYAWSDEVIGWIHFSGQGYGIEIVNRPPSAQDLEVNQLNYCATRHPHGVFSWTFVDADEGETQSAYRIQVAPNAGFTSLALDTGKITSSSSSYIVPPEAQLDWNETYYWRVKVWDSRGAESEWATGPSFSTPQHEYPLVDFSWDPEDPELNEPVQFTDLSEVFGGSEKSSWFWTFEDGNPSTSTEQHPVVEFSFVGDQTVSLQVTDSTGFSCTQEKTGGVSIPPPEWREIIPF